MNKPWVTFDGWYATAFAAAKYPEILASPNICPVGIYLSKVSNGNTRAMREIYSKLTIKIPERRQ